MNTGENRLLTAETIVINTGARPSPPTFQGADSISTLNSTSIMELDQVPSHLLIIGGGYVGLEFGQMFRRFGSQVTIIQRCSRLLSREDDDVADEVAGILRQDGIEIWLDSQPISAAPDGTDPTRAIQLTIESPGGTRTLSGSHLLAAAGRTPNSGHLDPRASGIEVNSAGYIVVNARLETNVPGVYALGDVKGGPAFTHISYDDYRIMRANLLHGQHKTITNRPVPYTVFIDPQLGRIGLTEHEARTQGLPIRVAKPPMSSVARAVETDETRGFMKAIVHAETQQILGAAVLGIEGGEIMSILEVAMMGQLPYTALRDAIFAHPTLAESLNNLFMALDG
jgi:pyruvate/2-oxoglutarate dehydrogenase complex dihydrolipoamide dehydrogenase (E3) component